MRLPPHLAHTGGVQDHHKLIVWRRAFELVNPVFIATDGFPKFGDGNLASQMRRAAVSVAMNISEGCGRKGGPDLLKFLRYAMGSASELECGTELSRSVGYLDEPASARLLGPVIEVKKMLAGLIKSLDPPHPPDRSPHSGP